MSLDRSGPAFLIARRKVSRKRLSWGQLSSASCIGMSDWGRRLIGLHERPFSWPGIFYWGRRGAFTWISILWVGGEKLWLAATSARVGGGVPWKAGYSGVGGVFLLCSAFLSLRGVLLHFSLGLIGWVRSWGSCVALFRAILDHVLGRMAPNGKISRPWLTTLSGRSSVIDTISAMCIPHSMWQNPFSAKYRWRSASGFNCPSRTLVTLCLGTPWTQRQIHG